MIDTDNRKAVLFLARSIIDAPTDELAHTLTRALADQYMPEVVRILSELPNMTGRFYLHLIPHRTDVRKINAIKLTRELNRNFGLKDAKDFVESAESAPRRLTIDPIAGTNHSMESVVKDFDSFGYRFYQG